MKILKRIGIILLILIAIPLIVAIFVKKDYAVEREIVINCDKQEVFDYIVMLKNQDNYSIWAQKDPNMKKSYKGTDGTVGFEAFWDSKDEEVGKGSQQITKIEDGKRIETKLKFKIPFEAEDDAYMTTEAANGGTKVKWGFTGNFPYPMNIMQLFMDMDEMVGKDLDTGLKNLKKVLESKEEMMNESMKESMEESM